MTTDAPAVQAASNTILIVFMAALTTMFPTASVNAFSMESQKVSHISPMLTVPVLIAS